MKNTETLSFREKLGYGLGDTASNFFFQVFNLFLLYYYTDVFGIAPAAVGTMFIVTKIIDAASDPLMGLLADRTNTRWGKFRPYILWGAVPYGLCGIAMFASPELSDSGKLLYAYVTYTAMMLAYTVINVPYSALMGVISPSSSERTKVSTVRFVCAMGAAWIVGTFVTPLKNILGNGNEIQGFRLTMLLFAVISVALFWITFATTKERVAPPKEHSNVKSDFKALFRNGPWIVLFLAAIFNLMSIAIRTGSLLYYFKYYLGDDGRQMFLIFDKTAIFLSSGTIALIGGIMLTKKLSNLFEKRDIVIFSNIILSVLYVAFFFIPSDMYGLMIIINITGAFVFGPTLSLMWAMYADCSDYGEWKTGNRSTALIFSTIQFAMKMGLAVGAGATGIILAKYGFIANQIQTEESLLGIRIMFTFIPAALTIAGVIAIYFYKIDRATIKLMEFDLLKQTDTNSIS
jgi:GPH family glycoside/pentoside/hexuronide:cation symporter